MSELDTRFALAVAIAKGIGPSRYSKIVSRFSNLDSFLAGADSNFQKEAGLRPQQIDSIARLANSEEIARVLAEAQQRDTQIVCLGQRRYPRRLTQIPSPPPILYVRGDVEMLDRPAIAVVGSRTPSTYGVTMTRKIAGGLAQRGLVIISGLALGIDSTAHRAALEVDGVTGAVLGCGIDIIYPAQNGQLAREIARSGYLVSEFAFGTKPEPHNFPRRNRIISGLALAVVVVEAAEKSGALVTASLALDQGREVFAVPGEASNPKSQGTIGLLKQGAGVVTTPKDILESLGWQVSAPVAERPKVELEPTEKLICDHLGAGPAHVDELVRNLHLGPATIAASLLKLELAGLIIRQPGNYVART